MVKIKKDQRGMVLTEALVSIMVLAITTLVMASLVKLSTDSTIFGRDNLRANSLLIEGVEAINNIRNNNWLANYDDEDCWMMVDPTLGEGGCTGANYFTEDSNYILSGGESGAWKLTDAESVDLDLETNEIAERVVYRLHSDDDTGYMVSTEDELTGKTGTQFYRSIKVVEIDNPADPNDGSVDWVNLEVRVEWFEGGIDSKSVDDQVTIYKS